ncbi:MAG: SLOG family protein [Clostridia bacterium]|nr:SLOG family protein [Clostridia bacterium]
MKVAFIGQINSLDKEQVKSVFEIVKARIEKLITEDGADEFIFGSSSTFSDLCYIAVTELKEKYPDIQRYYISMFSKLGKKYKKQLSESFERCQYPATNREMGRLPHIKVDQLIIDACDLIVTYYDKDEVQYYKYYEETQITLYNNNTPPMSKTKIALNYAFKNDKEFINLFSGENLNA